MNVLIRGIILTVLLVALGAPCALAAIDPPHSATNGISCANCHYAGATINSIGFTNFCNSCHRPGGMAQLHPFSPNDASNIFNNVTSKRTGVIQQHSHNWGGGLVVPRAGAVSPSPTSPLSYAPLVGLSCDRCHALHGPIQSATNSFPFLRMLKDQDQICFECHSPRKTTNQTTGTHPVTMTYTSAIKKFANYTSIFYTTPINANPANSSSAVRLNGGKVLCSTCHGVHYADSSSATFDNASSSLLGRLVSGDGFLLRTDLHGATPNTVNLCTNCHKGKYAHNGKNQNVQCADCHAGHVDEADGTKSNVWLVRRYMSYSTALTGSVDNRKLAIPTFFQSTTVKNYRNATNTGVCQSCHALPNTVAEHSKPTVDCNACHYHSNPKGSFAAMGCDGCHGQPPSQNVVSGPNGYAAGYVGVNEALSPHSSHAGGTAYTYTCNDCHKGYIHQNGDFQDIFLSPAGTTASSNGAAPVYNTTARTCATTYCHSNGAPRGLTPTYVAPIAWANGKGTIIGAAGGCAACHGTAATLATNAHQKHVNTTTGKGYACEACHGSVVTGSATIKDKTRHVDGFKNISFSANAVPLVSGAAWNTTTANCTNKCHTNGSGGSPVTVPNWTTVATGACGSCHNAANNTLATNAHTAHLNSATRLYGPPSLQNVAAAGSCQVCHTLYTTTAPSHVNGAVDFLSTTCTPCHNQNITTVGTAQTAWRGGRVTCESCHTVPLSVIGPVTAPDKTLNAAKGHGQSTFTGAPTCNSCHNPDSAHISGILGDNVRLTLANTNAQCASCHNVAAAVIPAFRNMSTHFTTKGGPQDMLCKQCHDPHGTSNLHMVRTQMKGTWANATTYTIIYDNAVNGFVNPATNRGLCQVCHTRTNHYKAGIAETSHPTSGCLDCHRHNAPGGAFKPKNTCDACHGYPPAPRNIAGLTFGTAGNFANAAYEDYSGGGGAHLIGKHIPASATADQGWVNCVTCHNSGSANHKTITPIKTNIANVTVVIDPKYKFNITKQLNYSGAKLVYPGNKTGSCTNVECHFQASPKWTLATSAGSNTPPTVSLTSPAQGTVYNSAPATVQINANANDIDGTITKVEFYNGVTLLGTSTTAPYSFTWNNVVVGTYALTARAYDNLGAVTTSTAVTIDVNVPPTVALTAPATGATFTTPATISLTATAADANGTVSKVEFYNGATLLNTDTIAPYSYSWTGVAIGTYTLTAKAYDNLGAVTTSTVATVTVSAVNVPPTVTLTAPANGAAYTAPATISLTAAAADSDGSVSKVEFYNGATLLGTATTAPYSYSWSGVAVGTYTLTAKAYDNAGAVTTSTAATVTVSAPANIPPTVVLTAPANGAAYTAPATIGLTATAADNDGTVSKVEFYNGATLLGTSTTAPYSYSWVGVVAGTYTLTAKAYDNLNAVTTSTAATVTVTATGRTNVALTGTATASSSYSTYLPATAINGDRKGTGFGVSGGGWLNSGVANIFPNWLQITFAGQKTIDEIDVFTLQDAWASPVEPTSTMTFTQYGVQAFAVQYWDGTAWVTVPGGSVTGNNLVWRRFTFPAVTTDRIRIYITGSADGKSRLTEVEAFTPGGVPANTPPSVALTAPANGATYTAPAIISLSATAADADGTVTKVDFYNGATLLFSDTVAPYSYSWTGVAAGSYTLTAVATDNSGATTTSTAATVTVSAPVNIPPTVVLTAPANGAAYTAPATIGLTATAADADGTVTKVDFYDGATLLFSDTVAPYSYSWTGVAAGSYTLTAVATDNSGATTTSTAATVTVSPPANILPTVTLTAPANNAAFTAPATISLTATAADSDGTVSKVEFYNGATLLGTSTTAPYSYSWVGVVAGTYTLTAKAYDNLNAVTTSTAATVTVTATGRTNVALTGTATASSSYSTYLPATAINGDRKGTGFGVSGGGWLNSGVANIFPNWLQITFAGQKTIDEIDVFTLQDAWASPVEPTSTMTFTQYGVQAFAVQYWDGTAWVTVPGGSVTGNNLVWRRFTFPAVTTDRIRIYITGSADGKSRLTEVEAYGN